jgi:hypothetical protein
LKCIYYGCHGLPYGKEDQTLFIDDEPSKVLQNFKWNDLFFESLQGAMDGPYISFVATFGWIATGQNGLSSL